MDGGEEYEAFGPSSPRGAGEADRRLRVNEPMVVFGNSGHPMREPGRVDHRMHSLQRGRHVLRLGEIANYCARGLRGHRGRPAQQCTNTVAAFRHFPEQVLTDEPGGASERKQHIGPSCSTKHRIDPDNSVGATSSEHGVVNRCCPALARSYSAGADTDPATYRGCGSEDRTGGAASKASTWSEWRGSRE